MTIGSNSVTLFTLQTHTSDPALLATHTRNTDQSQSDRAMAAACAGWDSAGIGDFTALPLGPLSMHQTPVKSSALWGKTRFKLTSEEFNMHHPGNNHRHF